jgi:hypothetical protein
MARSLALGVFTAFDDFSCVQPSVNQTSRAIATARGVYVTGGEVGPAR